MLQSASIAIISTKNRFSHPYHISASLGFLTEVKATVQTITPDVAYIFAYKHSNFAAKALIHPVVGNYCMKKDGHRKKLLDDSSILVAA